MLQRQLAYVSHLLCFGAATDPQDADIIWLGAQVDSELKSSLGLTDQQYTNQFPYEACLVMKHHLADTIHKVRDKKNLLGVYPPFWRNLWHSFD
jgi:hypothetical protein